MINVHPLYSSSSGNMFHFETPKANILIDAGVSYKAIREGLSSINKEAKDIDAVLITHEHTDHIKGIPLFCRKNPETPIYATVKTAKYLKNLLDSQNISGNIIGFEYNTTFKINDIVVTPFETSHDALMPCGYNLQVGDKKLSYATDLGYVSDEVFNYIKASDYYVIESNYDKTMLEFGKYTYPVKRRIAGPTGHLSNEDASRLIAKIYELGQAQNRFLLAHLSENNNEPNLAMDFINSTLKQLDVDVTNIEINIASKKLSNEEYLV